MCSLFISFVIFRVKFLTVGKERGFFVLDPDSVVINFIFCPCSLFCLEYSTTGDKILVVAGNSQPKVLGKKNSPLIPVVCIFDSKML